MNEGNTSFCTDQSGKNGIVLNRMYTGSYLSSNLGHEVINMFQADDENYYLYLNAKGNFAAEGKEVGTMLLVRGIGNGRIEVVGMAKNLQRVNSAKCTLSRDLGVINQKVRDEQKKFLEKIKYGDVPILDIFGEGGQQSIYISYWVTKDNFYTPKEGVRIIVEFPPQKKNNDDNTQAKFDAYKNSSRNEVKEEDGKITITIRLVDHNFSSTSLHQFILKNDDLTYLSYVCKAVDDRGNLHYWESKDRRINSSEKCVRREVSLFDICQIQNDENKFSNALSYFMMKYKKLWKDFFKEQIKQMFDVDEEIEIVSVEREEDAKVDEVGWKDMTGGRVDLLIRTKNSYIIIENKIDSSIIVNEVNDENLTQLERYYNYVEYLKYEEIEKNHKEVVKLTEEIEKYSKKYQDRDKAPSRSKQRWDKLDKTNIELQTKISEISKRKIFGFVLSPNYNKQEGNLLQICRRPKLNVDWYEINKDIPHFKWLSYGTMYKWLSTNAKTFLELGEKTYDADFKAFYVAMKKHTYDYENLALLEDMKNTFFARIKQLTPNSNTEENA